METCDEDLSKRLSAIEPNELARRARDGCTESFDELVRRFRPRLINLFRKSVGTIPSDCEDIAQETFVKVFQNLDRFDQRYRFSTWIYTIAIRLARDDSRTRRRRPQHVPLEEANSAIEDTAVADSVERQEAVDNIWMTARCVLTDMQYTAMWLRYAEDLSPADVAVAMQKTRIGIRVLLHRSRSILIAEVARKESTNSARRQPSTGGH